VAGEVALGASERFSLGLSLGDAAGEIGAGFRVDFRADDDGLVDRAVEVAVAAAGEPVSGLGLSGVSFQRGDAGESRERCFATAASATSHPPPTTRPSSESRNPHKSGREPGTLHTVRASHLATRQPKSES
jgi:hypothetical protein